MTLVTIGLLYFGSLYYVSRPSTGCLTSLVNEKSELSVENGGIQVPLQDEDRYTNVDIKPTEEEMEEEEEEEEEKRANAVIVILVRNNELNAMRRTIRQFEE